MHPLYTQAAALTEAVIAAAVKAISLRTSIKGHVTVSRSVGHPAFDLL